MPMQWSQINWRTIARIGKSRAVHTSYFWLFAVPFLARGLSRIEHLLSFQVFGQRLVIELSLPFSWKVFYFASLFFGVGTLIYLLRCPRIVADHTDAAHFLGAGKGWDQLNEYASDVGRKPVSRVGYTASSYGLGPLVESPEATYFWSIYYEALNARPVWLKFALVFYTVGFGFIAWLLWQNFLYVARVLMESSPSSGV